MKPAISLACSLSAPLEQDLEDYAAAKCEAVELYFGKVDQYLDSHSTSELRGLLEQHGLVAPVASFQGGLLDSQGDARREAWELFARRLATCRELGVTTLVIAGDVRQPVNAEMLERVQMSLRQAAEQAKQQRVRLALEFQARATVGNNLDSALALIGEVESPWLGICFDVFQYYTGPSKLEDFESLEPGQLFHVQVSDVAGVPRELATESDTVLPGDGDFQLEPIIERLRAIGYDGYVSLEILNPRLWSIPPLQVGEVGMTALRRLLGQASME